MKVRYHPCIGPAPRRIQLPSALSPTMSTECYPITVLPQLSPLYREYLAMGDSPAGAPIRQWYGGEPFAARWSTQAAGVGDPGQLADALERQSLGFGAGAAALANIQKLRSGARAIVTGQQVGLFGGPLLTLLKAATSIARAKQATAATGIDHVPVFWLATEDHDLAEVDHVMLPGKDAVERVRLPLSVSRALPVGSIALDGGTAEGKQHLQAALDLASDLLGYAPPCDVLRECYTPGATLGEAFARWMARLFARSGLIVMDASSSEFHRIGSDTLRFAIEHAAALESLLMQRGEALLYAGFHTQVLVTPGSSLLFLEEEGTSERQALKRLPGGEWKAGRKLYSAAELLAILDAAPGRISPNALLRPIFQDTILPTAAYIGGPAEIAYFAQSAVLYQAILARITPVLPRLSATVIERNLAEIMARHEVDLPGAMTTAEALAQRLGARAMPIEGKRRLAAAGNSMDAELTALSSYMAAIDPSLGRSATVAGNKMRYQMNRLRRLAATFELQKEGSLRKHATALTLHLFPDGHPQERVLGGIWFLAQDENLVERLIEEAANLCPGHLAIRL